MKKFAIPFVICALLFSISAKAQKPYQPVLQKESRKAAAALLKSGLVGSYPRHTEEYNWTTDWVLYQTIETSYTAFGEPSTIEYNQDGNKTRSVYSYNDQHYETEVLNQRLNGSTWVNVSRGVSTYNAQGYTTEYRSEDWNGSAWVMAEGTQYVYEMSGNQVHVITGKSWESETSEWVNSVRETYTYSGAANNYATVIMETWEDNWIPSMKMEYSWDGAMITESLNYMYENEEWVLSTKTEYQYGTNESMIMTSYAYMGDDQWMPSTRITFNYDSHGNAILDQMEMYMKSWMVLTAIRYQLTYQGNNVTQRITQNYSMFPPATEGSAATITWVNFKKEIFSNFASMSADVTTMPESGLMVFPNPAGKEAMIRISLVKAGNITLQLMSISGQLIHQESITANGSDVHHQMKLDGIRPGTYFLVARDKQGNEIGKTRLIKE